MDIILEFSAITWDIDQLPWSSVGSHLLYSEKVIARIVMSYNFWCIRANLIKLVRISFTIYASWDAVQFWRCSCSGTMSEWSWCALLWLLMGRILPSENAWIPHAILLEKVECCKVCCLVGSSIIVAICLVYDFMVALKPI